MFRTAVSGVVVAVALAASIHAAPFGGVAVSRGQAERNVLRFLQRGRPHHRLPRLINRRTHLLRNNTQAICRRARGRHSSNRFLCIVRPARHRGREGLYLSYRGLAHGRFRIRWLFYRRA